MNTIVKNIIKTEYPVEEIKIINVSIATHEKVSLGFIDDRCKQFLVIKLVENAVMDPEMLNKISHIVNAKPFIRNGKLYFKIPHGDIND
jgi:hypothetical protein